MTAKNNTKTIQPVIVVYMQIVNHEQYVDVFNFCNLTFGRRCWKVNELDLTHRWAATIHGTGSDIVFRFLYNEDAVTFKLRWL